MQHIPLVLETPSFELPREVWAKEIEVLNSLSGLDLDLAEEAGPSVELQKMVEEICMTVKSAEKASGKGTKKRQAPAGRGGKRAEEDGEDGEGGDEEEAH